jgi:hypothetical protein
MALQGSGAIKLSEIQTEFGGTNPISLSEYYAAAAGVPASGVISLTDFYGTSAANETTVTVTEGYSNPLGFLDLYGFTTVSPAAGSRSPTTYKGYTIASLYYLTDQSTNNDFQFRLENTGNASYPPSDTITSITIDVNGGTLQLDASSATITTQGNEARTWAWGLTGSNLTNVAAQWDASGTSDVVITDA